MGLWGYIKAPFTRQPKPERLRTSLQVQSGQTQVVAESQSPKSSPNASSSSPPPPPPPADVPLTRAQLRAVEDQERKSKEAARVQEYCRTYLASSFFEAKSEVTPILCGTLQDESAFLASLRCYKDLRREREAQAQPATATAVLCKNISGAEAYYARVACMKNLTRSKMAPTYTNGAILCQHISRNKHVTPIVDCYWDAMHNQEVAFTQRAAVNACRFLNEDDRRAALAAYAKELGKRPAEETTTAKK